MAQITKRFDGLESEMREMRNALAQLARTEERVAIIIEQNGVLFKRMDEMRDEISTLKNTNSTQNQSIHFFEKAGWMIAGVIGTIVGAAVSFSMKG